MRSYATKRIGADVRPTTPSSRIELAIIDLDNTLFDWVGFLTPALDAMVTEAASLLATDCDRVRTQLARIHARYANIEQPFALLDIPDVARRCSGDPVRASAHLASAFAAFDDVRQASLRPYPGVVAALEWLKCHGIPIAFYTDSTWLNAVAKLRQCDLLRFGSAIFAQPYRASRLPSRHEDFQYDPRLMILESSWRKPDIRTLRRILETFGASASSSLMIGDSISRDIIPAADLGLHTIWARYGTQVDEASADRIWHYTHWSRRVEDDPKLPDTTRTVNDPGELLRMITDLDQSSPQR